MEAYIKAFVGSVLLVFSFNVFAVSQLQVENEAGGIMAITPEPCEIKEALEKGLDKRAYATTNDGHKFEGCWNSPDVTEVKAPNEHVRIVPIVNLWFKEDGIVRTYLLDVFEPEPSHKFPKEGETWI